MANTIGKNAQGYGYKYTDLAHIHDYLEQIGATYYQYIERDEGDDYIFTVPTIDGVELPPRRGCRVVQATLSGKNNPAQEQGSALTYARRYSLLMAFGLATDDDDAESLTKKKDGTSREFQKPNADGTPTQYHKKDGPITTEQLSAIGRLQDTPERVEYYRKALDYWNVTPEKLTYSQGIEVIKKLRGIK
mgnify:CR=1 FL=1